MIELSLNLEYISKYINVPFLNFASQIIDRAGQLLVRVGGNTQDYATLVDSTPDGKMLAKVSTDPNNPVSHKAAHHTIVLTVM